MFQVRRKNKGMQRLPLMIGAGSFSASLSTIFNRCENYVLHCFKMSFPVSEDGPVRLLFFFSFVAS